MKNTLFKVPLYADAGDTIFLRFDEKTIRQAGFYPGELMDIRINDGKIEIERTKETPDIEEIAHSFPRKKSTYSTLYKGYKVKLKLEREKVYEPVTLSSAYHVYDFLRPLQYEPREKVLSLMLDTANRIVGVYESSKGTIDKAMLSPYEVIQPALLANSKKIVLAHNHPSGQSTPSQMDRDITDKIKKAADMMSMQLLDHVVIGDGNYTSFADEGYL